MEETTASRPRRSKTAYLLVETEKHGGKVDVLKFEVKIVSYKQGYGKYFYGVVPVAGTGLTFVSEGRLEFPNEPR